MAADVPFRTTFEVCHTLRPIFTGGPVSIDHGGRILATTLEADAVLTDPSTGLRLAQIEGDGEPITALARPLSMLPFLSASSACKATLTAHIRFLVTPYGSHLIICSRSLGMRIYILQKLSPYDGQIQTTLSRSLKPHGTPVVSIAVDQSGTFVATGGTDGLIKVWDIAGGYATNTFHGPNGLVTCLRFFEVNASQSSGPSKSSGRKDEMRHQRDQAEHASSSHETVRLLSGHQEGKVRMWDLQKRSSIAQLDSHVSVVTSIDFSEKQNTIVTASRDKTMIWWDASSRKVRKIVPCLELIEAVGFLHDGALTYSAGENGHLRFWEMDGGRELTKEGPAVGEGGAIVKAIYHRGLPFVLCIQADHTLAMYAVPREGEGSASTLWRRICGTHDEVIDLQYILPDRSIMALATNSDEIRIVSTTNSGSAPPSTSYFGQDIGTLTGHKDIIVSLDVDWSGHWIVTGAKDNTAKLWCVGPEPHVYKCHATFSGHAESIGAVALPRTVPPENSDAHADPLRHPPPYLLTGSQDLTVKKWDVPRQAQDNVKGGARALFTRKAHDKDINALDVHYSGLLFASASQDKTVKIWSMAEGEIQGVLRGHKRGVWSIKFSPKDLPPLHGQSGPAVTKGVILSASGDKTIKLWSLADYTCIRTFEGHSNTVLKVVWLRMPPADQSRRRIQFGSAGADGLVKVWNANNGDCECTLDNHEDRVWALAVHPVDNTIASGSSDSTVSFWNDTSSETQAATTQAAIQRVEQEQELDNFVRTESYREAITLALQLNYPARLLSLFNSVVTAAVQDRDSLCGLRAVDDVLASLSDDQLYILLLRLRDWNTNAKTAPVAQRILWTLLKSYPASRFSGLSPSAATGKGQQPVRDVLHALRAYTERHYTRLQELVDESYLVEYTLKEIDGLAPALEPQPKMQPEPDSYVVMDDVRLTLAQTEIHA